jgi:hypothetical protein
VHAFARKRDRANSGGRANNGTVVLENRKVRENKKAGARPAFSIEKLGWV